MKKRDPTNEVDSPKLYAILIGLSASAFSIVIALALLTPVTAFFEPPVEVIAAIVGGIALSVLCMGYMYGLLRYCQKARDRLMAVVVRLPVKPQVNLENVEPSPIGEDFIRIKGTPKTVRVTDGITVDHVRALASADLQAVSQRALEKAGVITRDPSVEVNAGVFIKWLNRNGFISAIGNSRYKFTPLGTALLKSVGGTRGSTPPTTTE